MYRGKINHKLSSFTFLILATLVSFSQTNPNGFYDSYCFSFKGKLMHGGTSILMTQCPPLIKHFLTAMMQS